MSLARQVDLKAIELARHVLRMTTAAGSGHPSSSLSILHIIVTLTRRVMRFDPRDPWNIAADRLVLSEGHAVPAVYAAYADLGGVAGRDRGSARPVTFEDLLKLREQASPLDGHPNPAEGFPFFDAATGSLGQGLSVAAGLALAARVHGRGNRFFTIIGDGESREGQIWEAADFIADHQLGGVVAIFNCNGQGQAGYVSRQQSAEALAAKLNAFGWRTRMCDGHDAEQLMAALSDLPAAPDAAQPVAVVARTRKGWGVELLADVSNHGKPLTAAQLPQGEAQLDETAARLGGGATRIELPPPAGPVARAERRAAPIQAAPFVEGMKTAGLWSLVEKNACATRRAYGAALLALGRADERVVALDGDVSNSTFAEIFAKALPARFFEGKIAEQNLVSAAVGCAAGGCVPFVSSFAKFLARAYDQVEMAQITRANIKLVGSHAGVSLAADGPSQMSLHDVAYFRSAATIDAGGSGPVCVSFQPADAVAAYACTVLMANHLGMCYLRTHRPDVPLIHPHDAVFEVGGSRVVFGGRGGESLTIVSSGYMVHVCLEAVAALQAEGVRATLIDAYSFPLKMEPILRAAADGGRRVLVVEDNYPGGLGDAIAVAAAERGEIRVESMYCRRVPKSARTPGEVLAYVGLSTADICRRARELAAR